MLPAPISTTAKGNQLEEAFVLWMEEHNYHSIVHVQGEPLPYIGGDYKPDILASRIHYAWLLLTIIGFGSIPAYFGIIFINAKLIVNNPGLFLCLDVLSLLLGCIGMTKCKIRYWVECKNLASPINRSVVLNLYASIAMAQKKKAGIWEGILVSRSDYRREILELAFHLGIKCYQWTGNEFQQMCYSEPEPDPFAPYV